MKILVYFLSVFGLSFVHWQKDFSPVVSQSSAEEKMVEITIETESGVEYYTMPLRDLSANDFCQHRADDEEPCKVTLLNDDCTRYAPTCEEALEKFCDCLKKDPDYDPNNFAPCAQ